MALDIIEDFIQGEGYKFLRLDGDTKSDQRQRDMDEFNKPGSDIFIYLLSTRAGGVGINLWSADTVIIFDPDFNPHQDLQAIARAHRMGQTKKVLVFKFMIKGAAEERIIQAGKRKLVLDHLIVQKMDDEEGEEDVQTILSFGAKALFEGDTPDARYTDQDVENLIEKIEQQEPEPPTEAGHTAMKFDFAKIWESGTNDLGEVVEADMEESNSYWSQRIARANELKAQMALQEKTGRGVRRKATQQVVVQDQDFDSPEKPKPEKPPVKRRKHSDDEDEDWKGPTRISLSPPSSSSGGYASGDDPSTLREEPKSKKPRKSYLQGDEGEDRHFPFPELLSSSKRASGSEEEGEDVWCHVCGGRHISGECRATLDRGTLLESRQRLLADTGPERDEALELIDSRLAKLDAADALRRAQAKRRTEEAAAAVAAAAAKIQSSSRSTGYANHPKLSLASSGPSEVQVRQKKPKAPERTIPCPLCGQVPYHIMKRCPKTQTSASIKQLLDDFKTGRLTDYGTGTVPLLKRMLKQRNGGALTLNQPGPSSSAAPQVSGPKYKAFGTSSFQLDRYPGAQ